MNLLNLEYFLVAAEEMNFTRAAKRLYIAQQSLSNHIARLEDSLGVELFDRTPPMTLTPAGLCLLRYAKQFQISLDDLKRELQDIKDCKSSELTLGITQGRGAIYLPILLPRFQAEYPNLKIHLLEASSAQLEQALHEGKADLIIGFAPKDPLQITAQKAWKEEYVILAPKTILKDYLPQRWGQLVQAPERVTLKDLEPCPFLSIQRDLYVGSIFQHCCARVHMIPNVIVESRNINIVLGLCMKGMGILVCPKVFLYPYLQTQILQKGELLLFPLDYSDQIYVSYLTQKYMSYGTQKLIELVQELGQELPNML
ncbi:LysR family transcriptional regulator [Muriventricola aceti]|uniref:LysR family transcriptional regulator n=1 Tax=Muriventricola aceti TaxID=2981773 RepID=UPI0008209B48|nr:LysR family transcriptional regulator [Muriventricola aceti]MCU6703334.1 LysR family transcriptional regulator [Muriventricola aceti]SCJ43530.1 Cyn operon transcriptional activator [uncultured Flavonifractor sp.]